jgi:hypothetical protein
MSSKDSAIKTIKGEKKPLWAPEPIFRNFQESYIAPRSTKPWSGERAKANSANSNELGSWNMREVGPIRIRIRPPTLQNQMTHLVAIPSTIRCATDLG